MHGTRLVVVSKPVHAMSQVWRLRAGGHAGVRVRLPHSRRISGARPQRLQEQLGVSGCCMTAHSTELMLCTLHFSLATCKRLDASRHICPDLSSKGGRQTRRSVLLYVNVTLASSQHAQPQASSTAVFAFSRRTSSTLGLPPSAGPPAGQERLCRTCHP